MIQRIDLRGRDLAHADLLALVPRTKTDISSVADAVHDLIEDVRGRGSIALLDQSERFDGVRPESVRVPAEALSEALAALEPSVRAALDEAIARVRLATAAQVPAARVTEIAPGALIEQRWHPVARVGLYVPGGKAVYPSSVVMNVVAAQTAGVASIALASPPQRAFGGSVHPTILAAAALLGVDEVYAMGGAGAIGALAHGVPDIGLAPVDVVTGPGNLFVAAAKRAVQSVVGIDAEAGPTEIVIIADDSADAGAVAADLISQAEHDELASSVLVTDSTDLAEAVERELEQRVDTTRHAERVRVALTGRQSAIVIVDSLADAAAFSNAYGPEHLEIHTRDDDATLAMIDSAGAIFLGTHAPVSLGDYLAGSNHVLPTGGQARHTAGLGAYTFLRPQQIVRYDREALREVHERILALSDAEDLPAHGEAISARFTR